MSYLDSLLAPSPALLAWLLAVALKSGVVLGAAAAGALVLGRAPAGVRRALWITALTGVLILPALAGLLPSWEVHWLPAIAPAESLAATASPRQAPPEPRLERLPEPHAVGAPAPLRSAAAFPRTRAATLDRAVSASPPAAAPALPRLAFPQLPWATLALTLWAAGCAAVTGHLLLGLGRARALGRGARPAAAEWRAELARTGRRLGIRRPVRLLLSDAVVSPMTWGWLRPRVLLPAVAASWSAERRRVVLEHELVHIRRSDWPARMLGRVVTALHWFNPLAWIAARRLALEQELACDDEVLRLGTRPSTYARHLLTIARSIAPGRSPLPALEMAPRTPNTRTLMEVRLMSILARKSPEQHRKTVRSIALPVLLLVIALVPALAAVRPLAETPPARASAEDSATAAPAELAGALAAMERVETRLRPLEAQMEEIERSLEPFEGELEAIERDMKPFEDELERAGSGFEPYEAELRRLQTELEPYERRLQAIEAELEHSEEDMAAATAAMRPREEAIHEELGRFQAEMSRLQEDVEPLQEQLAELAAAAVSGDPAERERLDARRREVEAEMRPALERLQELELQMRPTHDRLRELERQLEPARERMAAVHERMSPVYERLGALHEEMRPIYERMGELHAEMEPVHRALGNVHERMRPHYERLSEVHERMQPLHDKMAAVHERMQPLHEEMVRHHEMVHAEMRRLVEELLRAELAAVTTAGAPFEPAAVAVMHDALLQVEEGRVWLRVSLPEMRALLTDALGAHRSGDEAAWAAAIERAARAIAELELEAD